jgi:hypothetical protein
MRTIVDLPRPLLLRAVSRAARKRVPLSRFIAESLERELVGRRDPPPAAPRPADAGPADDPLFEALRDELGL